MVHLTAVSLLSADVVKNVHFWWLLHNIEASQWQKNPRNMLTEIALNICPHLYFILCLLTFWQMMGPFDSS